MSLHIKSKMSSYGTLSCARSLAYRTHPAARSFAYILLALTLLACSLSTPATLAYADNNASLHSGPSNPPLLTTTDPVIESMDSKLLNVSNEELADIFKTKTFGIVTGMAGEIYMNSTHPESKTMQYGTFSDAFAALQAGKVDYVMFDLPSVMPYVNQNADIFLVNRSLTPFQAYFITGKGNTELMSKIDGLLDKYEKDGTLEDLKRRWILNAGKDNYSMPDIPEADSNEVLHVAINYSGEPTMFYQGGTMTGYSVELAKRMAHDMNMKLTLEDMPFTSLLAAVETGKADCSLYLVKTEERTQFVDFSDPYLSTPQVLITKKDVNEGGFFAGLAKSAYATFIKDGRWMMIAQGLGVTVLISLCSFALANLIGALLCLLMSSRHGAVRRIARIYNAIVKGIPVLVLLMILYYVVFAGVEIPGIVVAIITFGLFYGSMLCNVFYTGVNSVDKGEIEAAKALGFSQSETFRHIVLPNAANSAFDVYTDYFITLTKGTSIVGYVAILDLTKVGDILRAQTYDAFFPLIVTAIIYFAITYLFIFLFRKLKRFVDPALRPRVVKGVDEHAWEASSVRETDARVALMRERIAVATGQRDDADEGAGSIEQAVVCEAAGLNGPANIYEAEPTPPSSRDSETDANTLAEPDTAASALIKVDSLEKAFGDNLVFKDVSFEVLERQIVSIIGPSGCGKSTILRCINMLEKPTGGSVFFRGERIPENPAPRSEEAKRLTKIREKIGMVFQSYNLFSHLMVVENLMLAPVKLLGLSRQEAFDRSMKMLDKMGLADKALSYPSELSGGQKQRVAIVRTLAMEPDIILFDEPTSALDPTMVREVTETIKGLAHDGMTMMLVTHDMDLARVISTQVMYMDEKGIYEADTPQQIFDHPKRQNTKEFLYSKAGVSARFTKASLDLIEVHAKLMGLVDEMGLGPHFEFDLCLVCEDIICNILLPQAPSPDTEVEMNVYPVKAADEMQISFKAEFITAGCEEQHVDEQAREVLMRKTAWIKSKDGLLSAAIKL